MCLFGLFLMFFSILVDFACLLLKLNAAVILAHKINNPMASINVITNSIMSSVFILFVIL